MTDLDAAARAKADEWLDDQQARNKLGSLACVHPDAVESLAALLTSHARTAIAAHEGQRGLTQAQADLIFERIKHGDEKHQAWLRDECNKLTSAPPAPEAGLPGREWQDMATFIKPLKKNTRFWACIKHGKEYMTVCVRKIGNGCHDVEEGSCVGWAPEHKSPAYAMPLPSPPTDAGKG